MDTMASMMLAHFWLKFTDMLLFTLCVVACVHISNIEVFETEGSYTKDTCINILFTFFYIFMQNLMMVVLGRNT
jgi:uncharacterized membrane protein YqaE (UPF0057 family)